MKKFLSITILLVVLGVATYIVFVRDYLNTTKVTDTPSTANLAEIAGYTYTENYANSDFRFGFKYPKDFTVTRAPNAEGNGQTILIQNISKKIGIQILITPYGGDDVNITPDILKEDIPDLKIGDSHALVIDTTHNGLSFISDNPNFGGSSSEIWFVYKKNFYQLSTYSDQKVLLNEIFKTWKFQ